MLQEGSRPLSESRSIPAAGARFVAHARLCKTYAYLVIVRSAHTNLRPPRTAAWNMASGPSSVLPVKTANVRIVGMGSTLASVPSPKHMCYVPLPYGRREVGRCRLTRSSSSPALRRPQVMVREEFVPSFAILCCGTNLSPDINDRSIPGSDGMRLFRYVCIPSSAFDVIYSGTRATQTLLDPATKEVLAKRANSCRRMREERIQNLVSACRRRQRES